MNAAIVSVIVANAVSILALVVSNVIQIIENKKSRYVTKITTETIAHYEMVRECSVVILGLTNPIRLAPDIPLNPEDLASLITAVSKLETYFVIVIKEEVEILTSMRKLVNAYMKYLSAPAKEQREEMIRLRDDFYLLISIYNYADWKYIKSQIRGQKTVKDFESYYKEERQSFQDAKTKTVLPDWETHVKQK